LNYSLGCFENGETITHLHRRIFRRLLELGHSNDFPDPFFCGEGSFYQLLKKNRLLVGVDKGAIDFTDMETGKINARFKLILIFLRVIKKMTGVKRYSTLIRMFQKLFAPENQVFLMKEFRQEFMDDYIKRIS
jgi:hypothetical protein